MILGSERKLENNREELKDQDRLSQHYVLQSCHWRPYCHMSVGGYAQQQESSVELLECTVISRYREESLQEVPDTIVALAFEIEQKGITTMDLTRTIPNMDFETVLHLGSAFINMRIFTR